MDTGRLETDFIKGARAWKAPASQTRVSNGQRYTLRLHVIRGKSKRSKAVKVIVEKDIELKRNFFSSSDQRPSDGLEEKVILYRIGRELIIEKALERAAGDS